MNSRSVVFGTVGLMAGLIAGIMAGRHFAPSRAAEIKSIASAETNAPPAPPKSSFQPMHRPREVSTNAATAGRLTLEDLPAADELRRIPVVKPETLATADPGLATAPPEQLSLGQPARPETAEEVKTGTAESASGQ